MAFITTIYCHTCGQSKQEVVNSSGPFYSCNQCLSDAKDKQHREWIAGREGLTIEERIREIEEWMYQHKHNTTHVPKSIIYG